MSVILGVAGDADVSDLGRRLRAPAGPADPCLSTLARGRAIFQQRTIVTTPEAAAETLPAAFADGRCLLAFDGRLDNRADLCRTLGIGRIAGLPDGAILAAAWEKWGEDSAAHLLGDFALAVWDDRRGSLTLACDQTTGGRPIYYHAVAARIVFSNSLAALLALPDVPRDLDPAALAGSARWLWPGNGATCFRDIRQLPPAGRLRWSEGRCTVDRYWQPDWSRRIHFRRDADYVETARDLLDRAVTAHSRVVGPLVCELSGGLDSTAVAATAARLHPAQRVHSVTAVSEDRAALPDEPQHLFYDEWARVRAVAGMHPNIAAQRLPAASMQPGMADPLDQFARTGTPGPNLFDSSWFDPVRHAVRDLGATSVLVGTAGNLTLSAAGLSHLGDLAAGGRWFGLARHAGGLARAPGAGSRAGFIRQAVRRALPGGQGGIDLGPAVRAPYRHPPQSPVPRPPTRFGADQQRFFDRMVESRRLANAISRQCHGIETRDPLGYLPLVEFCFAIPPEQYLLGGVHRSLARRTLADRLPPEVVQERRQGRQCPEIAARIASQRDWLAATIERVGRSAAAQDILDLPWIRATLAGGAGASPGALRLAVSALQIGQFILWVEEDCPGLAAESRFRSG